MSLPIKYYTTKTQLLCVHCLMDLKNYFQNKEIITILNKHNVSISESILSRYINGKMLPSFQKSMDILYALYNENILRKILERKLVIDRQGIVNITYIAFDIPILRLAACYAWIRFKDNNIDHVLTAAVNGIPLSTLIAELLDSQLAAAKNNLDAGISRYLEAKYYVPNPPRYQSLYLPYYELKPNSNILIVDDLLFSGRTLGALIELAQKSKSKIIGVFSLVAVGETWKRYITDLKETDIFIIKRIEE